MTNILALDTSGMVLSVALQCGKSPIEEKIHFGAWEHMENLLPFIDELLKRRQLTPQQIDCFLINKGPGSFTGLRIGFSTLKGFIISHSRPCYAADSLETLAERIPLSRKEKHLAVCLDAFRSRFYVKLFEAHSGKWTASSEPEALEIETAIQRIPPHALIAGDALKRHQNIFSNAMEKNFVITSEEYWYPRASSLLRLMENQPQSMQKLVSSEDFLPFYLRRSEPEERKAELQK